MADKQILELDQMVQKLQVAYNELKKEHDENMTAFQAVLGGSYWRWQGEGDELETITCPIIITKEELKAMIKHG